MSMLNKTMPTLVAGLGRCGTTLVMTMLHAAGVPLFCGGNLASFETDELMPGADMASLLPQFGNGAAKIIDPHRMRWPSQFSAKVIWLDRNFTEQAKSQAKFACILSGFQPPTRQHLLNIRDSLKRDTADCVRMFTDAGADVYRIAFERILIEPGYSAKRIASFLHAELDTAVMARQVIHRPDQCANGLDIEFARCAKYPGVVV